MSQMQSVMARRNGQSERRIVSGAVNRAVGTDVRGTRIEGRPPVVEISLMHCSTAMMRK